ncbi:MAG: hypothetical protein RL217_1137 [Pseudomonadota bacterium]
MKYVSLGSGSRGNATLVVEQGRALMIDCGFNRKTALQRFAQANFDPATLDAVFVTHEHGDHSKGVVHLCETLNIPFYASFGTAFSMQWLEHPLWCCVSAEHTVSLGHLALLPVVVPHDAKEPLQYVVENTAGTRLGVLSDLGSLTPHVISSYQDCHALQLEANHDPLLLQNGPYPPSLRQRVASDYGHLSNQQCAALLSQVQWHGLRHVSAGHISEKNNRLDLVQVELNAVLDCPAREIRLLDQDQVSPWLEFN